jgi:PknH-like extracellular domain
LADDDAEPTATAEPDGDETAAESDARLTQAIETAAAPWAEPESAHAWSLDDHSEEPTIESKWPGRLRWAGVVALLCATVAAVVWFSMVFYFGDRSTTKPSTPPGAGPATAAPPVVSAPAAGLPGSFPASAIDTVLLTPTEINTLLAGAGDPLMVIKETTHGMLNNANLVTPPACVGVIFTGERTVFASTGFEAMQHELLEPPLESMSTTLPLDVEQNVVVYPGPEQARTVLDSSQRQWQACANGEVKQGTRGQNGENGVTFALGPVQLLNNVLSVRMVANSQVAGRACEQVVAVRGNVLVSARSCRFPEPPPGQLDANIGSVRSDAEQLGEAMLNKIAPPASPPPSKPAAPTKPSASGLPSGGTSGLPCNASNAAKLGYDPKSGKEIVCVNQALTPNSPPSWQWAQPPPMTSGLNATGSLCDPNGTPTISRSSDGYLISCQANDRGSHDVGYWQHYLGPIE